MSDFSIDDMNTTLIEYSGSWQGVNGSTRQWDGTVHTTSQTGARATFQFNGYILRVWGTVAGGVGKNLVQLTIDGGPPNITSQASNGSAIFDVVYFETPLLPETFHTAVITNLGSTANGSTQFELDRFEFVTTDVVPLFAPPDGAASYSGSYSVSWVASTASSAGTTANTRPSSVTTKSSDSKSPVAAIIGGVVGALALVVIVLLFFLWRRRKRQAANSAASHHPSLPTPFPMPENYPPSTVTSSHRSHPSRHYPEKLGFSSELSSPPNPASIPIPPSSGSQTPALTINTFSSDPQTPTTRPNASSPYNELATPTVHYPSFTNPRSSVIHSALPSSVDMYDNPPPSYWYSKQDNDGQV